MAAIVAAVVTVGVLTACGAGRDRDMTDGSSGAATGSGSPLTRADLLARPALEDAVATYDAMLAEMRAALSEDFGGAWTEADPAGGGPAGDTADGVAASFASSPTWLLDASVAASAADKTRAIDDLTPIAVRYGFVEPVVFLDRDGEVQAVADDALGATLRFGSVTATTLTFSTGTHLTRAEMTATQDGTDS